MRLALLAPLALLAFAFRHGVVPGPCPFALLAWVGLRPSAVAVTHMQKHSKWETARNGLALASNRLARTGALSHTQPQTGVCIIKGLTKGRMAIRSLAFARLTARADTNRAVLFASRWEMCLEMVSGSVLFLPRSSSSSLFRLPSVAVMELSLLISGWLHGAVSFSCALLDLACSVCLHGSRLDDCLQNSASYSGQSSRSPMCSGASR